MEVLIALSLLMLAGLMAWMGTRVNKADAEVSSRVATLTRSNNNRLEMLRSRALEKNFNERVLFPMAQKLYAKIQFIIPIGGQSWVSTQLQHAGLQKKHYPQVFLGVQVILGLGLGLLMLSFGALFGKVGPLTGLIFAGWFAAAGFGLPMLWLYQQASKRKESIQCALPDFLDLLVICVEAGLGLDIAIHKIGHMKSVKLSEALRSELRRFNQDMSLGKARKQALQDLADRTGVDDLNSVITSLINAYEMGTGVTQALRIQSDTMRQRRLARAEEQANKIPVKMAMPIYIFLFPAIFVAIFGPMGMVLVKTVISISQSM
ncbi:MAG: type II secretion system F family protein [Vampirovibrionales bacterium]|nr:type II secretion system F family protein [Vampirovibrionales bacterium]